jgi:hypothetical protein
MAHGLPTTGACLARIAYLAAALCFGLGHPILAGDRKPAAFESAAPPGFIALRAAPVITLAAGQQTFLAVHVQVDNLTEPVTLSFSGLPGHMHITPAASESADRDTWRGILAVSPDAEATTTTVTIRARSGRTRAEVPFQLVVTRTQALRESPVTLRVVQESEVFPVLPTVQPAKPAESLAPAPTTPDRWLLMKALQGTWPGAVLDGERLSISGWTEGSFTASSVRDNQLPMGFNYLANQFALQQNWLRFERPVVTSGTTEPTFGFRNDWILPGIDYRFTISRGLFSGQLTADNGQPNTYGIDPVQFYAEAYFPTIGRGLDVKVGRIFCQYGAETIDAPPNALASHSYTFIYDPFTHTGIMGTLQLTPAWSVQLGIILGPDVFFDPAASPYSMFSVKWAPPGGRDSVFLSGLLGSGRFNVAEQFNNPNIIDLVYVHTFNAVWTYTLDTLFGYQTNIPDIGTATWFSAANYFTYKFTPRLAGTTRLEFFDDVDGSRTGFKGLYTAITVGPNFQPRKDLIVRPELRYDYNEESRPFQGHHGVFTATTDVIVRW